jgi:hypothetical protein
LATLVECKPAARRLIDPTIDLLVAIGNRLLLCAASLWF